MPEWRPGHHGRSAWALPSRCFSRRRESIPHRCLPPQARRPLRRRPGTLLHKAIPPRMVEPYLTGRRSIIAGFVHRVADSSFTDPRDLYYAMSLDYEGSEFRPDMEELYVLRWRAVGSESYSVPYSVPLGGDWI